jgi:hypothetical protein
LVTPPLPVSPPELAVPLAPLLLDWQFNPRNAKAAKATPDTKLE